jgi:hypothetical protein
MSLEQIQDFLDASQEFRFEGKGREEMYEWMKKTLVGQQYHIQGKAEKGLLRSYLGKMTGLSRAQVTRLIGQYLEKGSMAEKRYSRRRFRSVYTRADIGLVAEVDEAHETLSGPATQKILYPNMGIQSMSVSAGSRCRTSIICARVGRTGNGGSFISRPGRSR